MAHGSVTWLGGDRWEARVTTGRHPSTGRRTTRSRTITAPDRDEAERALQRFVLDLGLDPDVPATLAGALEAWYAHTEANRTPAANKAVRITLDRHVLPGVGHLALGSLSVGDLERFYAAMSRNGYASSTVRHAHYAIRPALRLAVRWGWLDRSPAEHVDVELPAGDDSGVEAPPVETVLYLLDHADDDLATYCRVLAVTGARPGEVAALRWADVDAELATVTIAGALAPNSTERKAPKTRKGRRRVSVDPVTIAMLTSRRAGAPGHHYVFPDTRDPNVEAGTVPVRTAAWSSRWVRLCKRAQVTGVRLYDLRHLSVSLLLDEGVPVARISARIGHARTSTTTDIYGHLIAPGDDDLAAALSGRFRPARG